jgi:hypothetical protein
LVVVGFLDRVKSLGDKEAEALSALTLIPAASGSWTVAMMLALWLFSEQAS